MIHYQAMSKRGFVAAIVAAIAMSWIAYLTGNPMPLTGQVGVCLPSPNMWPMAGIVSWAVNLGLILLTGISVYFLNKTYSFIPGSSYTVLPGMYMLMTAANPWISGLLTSSTLLALANVLALAVMFSCYRQRNSTQEIFAVATVLSLGTMVQYSFLFFIPAYIIIGLLMKCFHFKEAGAFLLGLIAPYWVGVGLGLIPLENFRMPTFTNLFDGYATQGDLLVGLITIAGTGLIGLVLGLNNWVKLYAGNTHRRLCNGALNVIGVVCILCIIFDSNNMLAYLSTFYLLVAVQLANVFALHSLRRGSIWLLLLCLLYIASFVYMESGAGLSKLL